MFYARRSARVLLVDAQDRVLLFSFWRDEKDHSKGEMWLTPGGGVDKGEELHEAASRELWEEAGLRVPPSELLPLAARSEGHADLGWLKGRIQDNYFLHRVSAFEVDTSHQEAWESRVMSGWRWWTVEELRVTDAEIIPPSLADLVTQLVLGGPPAEPVLLDWHH